MREFRFRKQFQNTGALAGITFDFKILPFSGKEVNVIYHGDPCWELACRFGVQLFYDYWNNAGMLQVEIFDVYWLPVDTDNLAVVWATVGALTEALEYKIEGLEIDSVNRQFKFPHKRGIVNRTL